MNANRSHLTPEQRVNKLGHVVTKHVNQQQAGASTVLLPAPVPPELAAVREERERRIDRIVHQVNPDEIFIGWSNKSLKEKLQKIGKDYLDIVEAAATWNVEENANGRMLFIFTTVTQEPAIQGRELLFFLPYLTEIEEDHRILELIKGLHRIDLFKDDANLAKLKGHKLDAAKAILRVSAALGNYTDGEFGLGEGMWADDILDRAKTVVYLKNRELLDFIVERPEKVDMMIEFIADRASCDVDQMRAYVEDGSALRDGLL